MKYHGQQARASENFAGSVDFETPRPDLPVHFLNFQTPSKIFTGPGLLAVVFHKPWLQVVCCRPRVCSLSPIAPLVIDCCVNCCHVKSFTQSTSNRRLFRATLTMDLEIEIISCTNACFFCNDGAYGVRFRDES